MSAGQKETKKILEQVGALHYELHEEWFNSVGKIELALLFKNLSKKGIYA